MSLNVAHRLFVCAAITCFAAQAKAAPELIPVQGYLTDDLGVPLDGPANITLRLYSDAFSPTPLHEETQDTVLSHGYFTVFVGSEEPLNLALFRLNPTVHVGIAVNSSPGTGVEFVPRVQLGTSPYAAYCAEAAFEPTTSGLVATDVQGAIDELASVLDTFIDSKGAANGLATLDGNTRVPSAQLGSGTADNTRYLRGDGTWATLPTTSPTHASSHQHGGPDEIATATSAANAIPKANASGRITPAWLGSGTANSTTYLRGDNTWQTLSTLAHAASHQHSGTDEIATATSAGNAIPKANSSGQLSTAWLGTGTANNTKYLRGDNTWQTLNAAACSAEPAGAVATHAASNTHLSGTTVSGQAMELNTGGSGNRNAYIDFHADDTNTDYALRIIRNNTGVNANSIVDHTGTGTLFLRAAHAGTVAIQTNASTRMVAKSSGYIGIGTSDPTSRLEVVEPDADYIAVFKNQGGSSNSKGIQIHAGLDNPSSSGDNKWVELLTGSGTLISTIRNNSVLGAQSAHFYSASDARLKKNIRPTKVNGLEVIQRVALVEYEWKDGRGPARIGYIAQELKDIYPEMVAYDDMREIYMVADTVLIPVLVKATQELSQRNNELETRVMTLEDEVAELRDALERMSALEARMADLEARQR